MKSKRDLLPRDYPPPRSPLCPFVLLHARKIRVKYYNAYNTRFTITRLRSLNLIINSRIIENVKKLIKSWWKYNYTTVYLIREMNIYLIIERKKLSKKYNGIFCIRFLILFFFLIKYRIRNHIVDKNFDSIDTKSANKNDRDKRGIVMDGYGNISI